VIDEVRTVNEGIDVVFDFVRTNKFVEFREIELCINKLGTKER
jgi:hypothetical protein